MNEKAFSPIEEIIVIVMISIFIAVLYHRYHTIEIKAKTEESRIDLHNLRLAVELFKVRKGHYPVNLYQLYKSGFLDNAWQKNRISNGKIIDPFGNAYIYDNITGKVFLSKKSKELIGEKQ